MAETPNHGYNVPDEGDKNWHQPLNENFEQYDTDVEIRDEEVNLDDYDPKEGAKFLAVDTGAVYVGDGAAWQATAALARYEDQGDGDPPGLALGDSSNAATAAGATVAGGEDNAASGSEATVSGGSANTASGTSAVVGGGKNNAADSDDATVAGGQDNDATGSNATVGGGATNEAGGNDSVVAGGLANAASGWAAAVPGGRENAANGANSFAAGRGATADHDGSFVWADGADSEFTSTGADQFLIDAAGGVGIGTDDPQRSLHVTQRGGGGGLVLEDDDTPYGWGLYSASTENLWFERADDVTGSFALLAWIDGDDGTYTTASDAELKRDVEYVDGVLEDVCSLSPASYRLESADENAPRSYGFLAQEVAEVFPDLVRREEDAGILGLAYDDVVPLTVGAINEQQALIDDQSERIDALEAENEALRERLEALEQRVTADRDATTTED